MVRIDDLDTIRVVEGASDAILRTLESHGLTWDGSVVFQSQQTAFYQAALETLDRADLLYACRCSRKRLSELGEGDPRYPGLCRNARHDRSQPHALRIRTNLSPIALLDGLQGPYEQRLERGVGDFVLKRRDGVYAYHLATVVDDQQAGVNDIVRGYDLLESTPRQIFLQQRLDFATPSYRHLPVLIDKTGTKLSKQTGADPVAAGNPSETLLDLLRLMRQAPPDELRHSNPEEILRWAIAHWDIRRLTGLTTIAHATPSPQP